MRENKLQVGDWMQHVNGKYYQVTRIDMLKDGSIHYACGTPHLWEYNNKFSPVVLTHEILEKNGFEYCEVHRMYLYLDDFFDIKIRQYSDMMWEFTYCNNEMNLPDTQIAGIGYVHHLQHALNMVGVEKDIII